MYNACTCIYLFLKNTHTNRALSLVVKNFTCLRSENKTVRGWPLNFAMTVPLGKRAVLKLAGMPFLVSITEPVDNVPLFSKSFDNFGDVNQLSIVTW